MRAWERSFVNKYAPLRKFVCPLHVNVCICVVSMHTFIGLPDSPESDFLDSKRPELPKMEQNGLSECREPDSPESGKPMNMN
jgi:hypothetical protein